MASAESAQGGSFLASARAAFAGRAAEAEGAGATVLVLRPSVRLLLFHCSRVITVRSPAVLRPRRACASRR